jgi:dynein light chain LC8-type
MANLKVISVDMEDDMHNFALQTIQESFDESNSERLVSQRIKKNFDDHYQPAWSCIVGRDFGSHVVHQTKRYIFLCYHESVYVLLWKSN